MPPSKFSAFSAVAAVVLLLAAATEGQTTTPSCAQSLVPCANYINATNPPDSCCRPLKDAIDTQLTCLCNLYNTPGLLKSFGINTTDALLLPSRCKLSSALSDCVKASGPASSSVPPPASPGKDDSGGTRVPGSGMLSMALLMFWAYVAFY